MGRTTIFVSCWCYWLISLAVLHMFLFHLSLLQFVFFSLAKNIFHGWDIQYFQSFKYSTQIKNSFISLMWTVSWMIDNPALVMLNKSWFHNSLMEQLSNMFLSHLWHQIAFNSILLMRVSCLFFIIFFLMKYFKVILSCNVYLKLLIFIFLRITKSECKIEQSVVYTRFLQKHLGQDATTAELFIPWVRMK